MKTMLPFVFALALTLHAADLPTVTVEHLYYLQARAERVRKLKPDEMIEYCVAQKLGGTAFENLYVQVFSLKVDLTKLLKIEEVIPTDPRVVALQKSRDAYEELLREEAKRVQRGLVSEGQVATDTMSVIARVQQGQ